MIFFNTSFAQLFGCSYLYHFSYFESYLALNVVIGLIEYCMRYTFCCILVIIQIQILFFFEFTIWISWCFLFRHLLSNIKHILGLISYQYTVLCQFLLFDVPDCFGLQPGFYNLSLEMGTYLNILILYYYFFMILGYVFELTFMIKNTAIYSLFVDDA